MKKFVLYLPICLLIIFLVNTGLHAQVVFSSSTPGIYTYTVPSTSLYRIETWGGGGRGGPRANNNGGAGGGGGGAYSTSDLYLVAGTYTIKVGTGGLDPGNADGDSSYVKDLALIVLAMGGKGVNANNDAGQPGGLSAQGIGATKYSGGTGANGILVTPFYGGGGGSSAGTASNGNNGLASAGGPAPVGGAKGGNGRTATDGPGLPGDTPGGGGGGARKTVSGGGQNAGGLGGNGKVVITLLCLPPSIETEASDVTVECDGLGNEDDLQNWLDSQGGAVAIDGCGELTWSSDFDELSDDCGATGSATVTFTVTDENGDTAQTTASFTIEDTTPPTAVCQDVTLEFDAYGDVSISADGIDNGSSDVCGDVTLSLSQTDFDCTDLDSNIVTLTVTDECGNTSTCTALVIVKVPLAWRCHNGEKVIFCHVPPNYPADNIQEICVGMDAETICDHLGHGDHFGPCDGTEEGSRQVLRDYEMLGDQNSVVNPNGEQITSSVDAVTYVQPNPFSSKATIHFSLAKKEIVELKVFNNMGQVVSSLQSGPLEAGKYTFDFDGAHQSEGLYYFSLVIGSKVENIRMILNR